MNRDDIIGDAMDDITEIGVDQNLNEVIDVIRRSFLTVAEDFGLTRENAPTNPAFIEENDLKKSMERGLRLYTAFDKDKIIGCVGIEASNEKDVYFLERLAVAPEYRHGGHGACLMEYALERIKENKGKRVSIGIINENERLKEWYKKLGFIEKGHKTFHHLPFAVCFMEREL